MTRYNFRERAECYACGCTYIISYFVAINTKSLVLTPSSIYCVHAMSNLVSPVSTPAFQDSYERFADYPCNLVVRNNYSQSLDDQKARFDADCPSMLADNNADGNSEKVWIILREWNGTNMGDGNSKIALDFAPINTAEC
jgi:hypothetical protein